jgi:hypothetical protein
MSSLFIYLGLKLNHYVKENAKANNNKKLNNNV